MSDLMAIPLIDFYKKLFELGDLEFITKTDKGENIKQREALKALMDPTVKELLFGGAAGGAKSWTGAAWLTFMCLCFPGTKWFTGREALKSIKESTYITFLKVFKWYGVTDVKYNAQDYHLTFSNGSRIDFLELKSYPSDPMFERFGSIEYTGGWIEEGGEVDFAAFDVLKTRIGRHLNDMYGIRPILLITCNPKKNWLYYEFYMPARQGCLKPGRKYIQAFAQDNPANESGYIEQLNSLQDKSKRERLLLGNWDYEDDPATLCDYDAIVDMFTNDHVRAGENRLSADLAMRGRDRFVCGTWQGLIVNVAIDKEISTGKEIEQDIKGLMVNHSIPRSKTVADSDGLGSYLESYLTGIKEFHGGAKAVNDTEFANLKSECGYKLAEVVNKRLIKVHCSPAQKQRIIEEIGVLKSKDVDADEKRKRIIQKDEMKKTLGRSPDYLDMLLMGMYFEIKKEMFGYAV